MSEKMNKKKLIKLIKKNINEIRKLNEKYYKMGKSDLEYIARKTVDEFYEDYEPLLYDRYGDLYNAYAIIPNKLPNGMFRFDVLYDWKLMQAEHRVSNEYIYTNSFIYGWHGGARSGKNHPDPGQAWWREPVPYFTQWKSPSARSDSIKDKIVSRLERHVVLLQKEMQKEYEEKIVSSVKKGVDSYLKG